MVNYGKQLAISLCEWGYLLAHPSHWRLLANQGTTQPSQSDATHLKAALDWLCRAHDAGGGGVSAGYFLRRGWMPPYPETTGYIIPTLLRCADSDPNYIERAHNMGDWEIEIQLPSGAVRGGIGINDYPIVFNCGQVILGWTSLYRHARDDRYLQAAMRAADWLVSIQDTDGKWVRHTYLDAPRSYHARVAWPLLEVHALSGDMRYRRAALRFLDWLLPQQHENGFFPHMALEPGQKAITHTIAYTLRGLLECAGLLGDEGTSARAAVQLAASHLLNAHPQAVDTGFIPAALDASWQGATHHTCLTGNAQLAIVFLALSNKTDQPISLAGHALIERLKKHQSLSNPHPGIRGGIPSSFPIWGSYVPYAILNWATKFFADALLAKNTPPLSD